MTLPISDDDDVTPPASDREARPDWLVHMDQDLGPVAPRPVAPRPSALRPGAPPAGALPPIDREHSPAAPVAPDRAEGLVRPATPDVPLPARSSEWEHRGYEPTSLHADARSPRTAPASAVPRSPVQRTEITPHGAPAEPAGTSGADEESASRVAGAAWTAAASSIPSLRGARRRPATGDDPTPDDPWENEPFSAPRSAVVESATPVVARPREGFLAAALEQAKRIPLPVLAVAAGVVVVVAIAAVMMQPKEEFTSIRHIKTHAREMDGRRVHIRGTVGQSFPVGGGFAFYLHQKRDTIVVFTRNRTPVERQHIKLMGTVSTGVLEGAARAAIFEDPAPPS